MLAVGTYEGNGSSRSIQVGFQPSLVLTASTATKGPPSARGVGLKFASMLGDKTFLLADQAVDGAGVTLTPTGFGVGNNEVVNKNKVDHHYLALGASRVEVGSYVGDGAAERSITLGQQPAAVWLCETTTGTVAFWGQTVEEAAKNSNMIYAGYWTEDPGLSVPLRIQSTGFKALNTNAFELNVSGSTYFWAAFFAGADLKTGEVLKNGGGTENVVVGWQPKAVVAWGADRGGFKLQPMGGDKYGDCAAKYEYIGGGMSLAANGFSLGPTMNNGTFHENWWMALQ